MEFRKGLHQGRAQAGALGVLGTLGVAGMLERLLDARQVVRHDARTIILYRQAYEPVPELGGQGDGGYGTWAAQGEAGIGTHLGRGWVGEEAKDKVSERVGGRDNDGWRLDSVGEGEKRSPYCSIIGSRMVFVKIDR